MKTLSVRGDEWPDDRVGAVRPPRASTAIRTILSILALLVSGESMAAADDAPVSQPFRLERPQDGQTVAVHTGAPALHVFFFATWCPPCMEDLQGLADLEAKWVDRGYRLVIVAVPTRQTRESLAEFIRRTGPPGETLFDASGETGRVLGLSRLPAHVILDEAGRVVLRTGRLEDGVDAAIQRLLGAKRRPARAKP